MKKKFSLTLCFGFLLSIFSACNIEKDENIVILYENDVHCEIEGYSKLKALKNELIEEGNQVGVVSSGDFVQGGSLGVISKGEYIVNLMNLVGYDALTLGNHEFDYKLDRLNELVDMMDTKPVLCNFQKIDEDESYFDSYSIVEYGDVEIGYIGIITPETISSSSPDQFKDENGNFIYTFNVNNLIEKVQESIDELKKEKVDYIVALSHVGYTEAGSDYDIVDIINETHGLDVVLDGHSHSVIENLIVKDSENQDVILSSTGTKFEYVGKLEINDNNISTELIKLESYDKVDEEVTNYINEINEEYFELANRKIGYSEVDLITHDEEGNRLVRNSETNLGNLCSDAYRILNDTDIGYVNGGGIRNNINKGDITFNDILEVYPFNNTVVTCEIKGQILKDFLEATMYSYPLEDGCFPHLSGMRFTFNSSIPTSVVFDENEVFQKVDGEYRVSNIEVLNKVTNEYEPLDLNKTYTLASNNFIVVDQGSGMSMFKDVKILENAGVLDVELLETYIVDYLKGNIGLEYKDVKNHITFIN